VIPDGRIYTWIVVVVLTVIAVVGLLWWQGGAG